MEENLSIRVFISGRVQGVYFRMETKKYADRIGVKGWVRNMADGRVEAFFQGSESQIAQMTDWCRKGAPLSRVTDIETIEEKVKEKFTSFEITY